MEENETFNELIKRVSQIVNNDNFKIFCNPNSLTYTVSEADTERVLLAYGILLKESTKTDEN